MNHRHLLPAEIDVLLDGERAVSAAPQRAHLDECEECRGRLTAARRVVDRLEDLSRFAPRPRFADRVLANVQVIEPWYFAAWDALARTVPKSPRMRALMGMTATVSALGISASAVWLALRADFVLYAVTLLGDRLRTSALTGLTSLFGETLGLGPLDAVRAGGLSVLAVGAGVLAGSVGAATLAFRAFASASRRARE